MSATTENLQPVQMWNGVKMSYVTEEEAVKLEKAGTHQRTKGISAHSLKAAGEFRTAAMNAKKKPAKAKGKPPRRARGGKTYHTTQMKAE